MHVWKMDGCYQFHFFQYLYWNFEMQTKLSFTFTVKLISYMDEKEEKEAVYFSKLCRWHEANLILKKLIWKRYSWKIHQINCKILLANCFLLWKRKVIIKLEIESHLTFFCARLQLIMYLNSTCVAFVHFTNPFNYFCLFLHSNCSFFVRPDQWSYYQSYFSSAFSLIKQGWKPDDESE